MRNGVIPAKEDAEWRKPNAHVDMLELLGKSWVVQGENARVSAWRLGGEAVG
jgi:hypothetical protein